MPKRFAFTFVTTCPMCGAFVEFVMGHMATKCQRCKKSVLVGVCRPKPDDRSQIDSFFPGERWDSEGPAEWRLHAVGTKLCHWCGVVFGTGFSCCPNLLKVAIDMWDIPPAEQGPNTKRRVRAFLRKHRTLFTDYLPEALKARNFEKSRLQDIAKALKIDAMPA